MKEASWLGFVRPVMCSILAGWNFYLLYFLYAEHWPIRVKEAFIVTEQDPVKVTGKVWVMDDRKLSIPKYLEGRAKGVIMTYNHKKLRLTAIRDRDGRMVYADAPWATFMPKRYKWYHTMPAPYGQRIIWTSFPIRPDKLEAYLKAHPEPL